MSAWNAMTHEGKDTISRSSARAERMFAMAKRPAPGSSYRLFGLAGPRHHRHLVDTNRGFTKSFETARRAAPPMCMGCPSARS